MSVKYAVMGILLSHQYYLKHISFRKYADDLEEQNQHDFKTSARFCKAPHSESLFVLNYTSLKIKLQKIEDIGSIKSKALYFRKYVVDTPKTRISIFQFRLLIIRYFSFFNRTSILPPIRGTHYI